MLINSVSAPDKLIVAVALVLLVQKNSNFWFTIPAIIIVCREITVSALREWMAEVGKSTNVAVCWLGKLKTFHEGIISGDVTLRLDKADNNANKIAEIKLHAPGQELFAKKQCPTFEEAVDSACDAIKTQIIKHKEKHFAK